MAKVKQITKAGKSTKTRRCTICGHEVQVGESYKFVSKRTGPAGGYRLIFCSDHSPRQSHLLSGRSAQLARIGEDFTDTINALDVDGENIMGELSDALTSAADEVESMSDEIKDASSSLEEGFGHATAQSEAMAETATELSDWAERIRGNAERNIQNQIRTKTPCL